MSAQKPLQIHSSSARPSHGSKPERADRRVVLTGLGPVTPIGIGKEAFWRNALGGRSAVERLQSLPGDFPADSFASQLQARIRDEELRAHRPKPYQDRRLVLAELAARLAVADAGLPPAGELEAWHGLRAGIVMGNAVGAPTIVEREFKAQNIDSASTPFNPELLDFLLFHTPSAFLADRFGLQGPELTISTGCTAGLDAIGSAFEMVRSGVVDLMLAGSAEAPLTPVVFTAFDRIGALSTRNHDPVGASRPFDRERDGFVLAEGAAVLVLESLDHALERGAHVYAEIEGFTSVSNGYHMTNLPEDGASLARCLALCLSRAGIDPESVDHVNAHGSSTPQNDLCETNAVKSVFGNHSSKMTINSLKSMIGHALGASNAIEIVACALSLQNQEVHPTANFEVAGDGCDLDYVPFRSRSRVLDKMAKLSSGFSGIHSAMVLGRHRAVL